MWGADTVLLIVAVLEEAVLDALIKCLSLLPLFLSRFPFFLSLLPLFLSLLPFVLSLQLHLFCFHLLAFSLQLSSSRFVVRTRCGERRSLLARS